MLKKWDLQKDTEKEFKRLTLLQNGFKSNSGVYNLFHKYKARYGHIHLGYSRAKTAEQRKAVSVNVLHRNLAVTDEVYMRMSSDEANQILVSFDFDENDSYSDDQPVSNTEAMVDPSAMNDMMIKLFSAMDPEILIQTGMALKSMKNGS